MEKVDGAGHSREPLNPGNEELSKITSNDSGNGGGGRGFIFLLTFVASLGGALFGYDTGVVSGAMLEIKSNSTSGVGGLDLGDFEQEMVVSITTLGAFVGAVIAGPCSDRFGRLPSLQAASILFVLGAGAMAVAPNYGWLLVGRSIVGLSVGAASHTVPLYLAEVAPSEGRGRLVVFNNIFIVLGQVVASLVDCGFGLGCTSDGWRYMLGIGAVPALGMLAGLLLLPESPRWLLQRGETDRARDVLIKARGGIEIAAIDQEMQEMQQSVATDQAGAAPLWEMLREPGVLRALRLGCFLQAFQQLAGINTLMYYSATILQAGSQSSDLSPCDSKNVEAICLSAAVAFAQLVGNVAGMFLVDSFGRRTLLLWSTAGVSVCLVLLGLCFYGEGQSNLAVWAMVAYLIVFGVGLSPMPWTVNSEIYPLRVRSTAVSISTGVNWVANYIVSATFLTISTALSTDADDGKDHPDGAFWLYAAITAVGWVWLYCYMPETKGKALEEIEELFAHPGRPGTRPSLQP